MTFHRAFRSAHAAHYAYTIYTEKHHHEYTMEGNKRSHPILLMYNPPHILCSTQYTIHNQLDREP
jgi:hypothetical protein